ncbi:MAG: NAD(P)/FAD-dependent oxidoreductase [Deinococcota bacterium]
MAGQDEVSVTKLASLKVGASHKVGASPSHFEVRRSVDVAIVGAGPVGLFAALACAQQGLTVQVLEARPEPKRHSRAIGVHPPALVLLDKLGVANSFCERGLCVRDGVALGGVPLKELGRLEFKYLPPPYQFVLAIRQDDNECILSEALDAHDQASLARGVHVTQLQQDDTHVEVSYTSQQDESACTNTLRARFVFVADGKRSTLREQLGIGFKGGAYPHKFVMGDFADSTDLGPSAGIFLTADGLVESFPLPHGVRRWVVQRHLTNPNDPHTNDSEADDMASSADKLVALVETRTGIVADVDTNTMLSSFGVERYVADKFVSDRIALLGDAAHVISPIGGQGMNIGWLGAWDLITSLTRQQDDYQQVFAMYAQRQLERARNAAQRAEFNMQVSQSSRWNALRNGAVWSALHSPIKYLAARQFTMHGL